MIYQDSIYAIPQLRFGKGPYSCHYHGTTTTLEMDQFTSVAMEVAWVLPADDLGWGNCFHGLYRWLRWLVLNNF